jgi:hypothetical protein
VVTAVVTSWSAPGGPDEDKWLHCGYIAVDRAARDWARRWEVKEEEGKEEAQLILPGYEKLRRFYTVKGETVRVDRLTISDAMAVLAELDRCESGIRLHRNELQRYIDEVLIPAGNGN